jgi:phosphatidylserine/phosphatidylglycerophosphate/cardiolipin synthase-like enzyme
VLAGTNLLDRFANIALAISNVATLSVVCVELESGRLNRASTSVVRAALAGGNVALEAHLRNLHDVWNQLAPELSGQALALILRASEAAAVAARREVPITQVVWSGPKISGSFLRATREVVREILRQARRELLIVGYWIAASDDEDGIIEEYVGSLADAAARGVSVTVIIDERVRPDGRDNRQILVSAWPSGRALPALFTWRLPPDDRHLKLHAKVLVADRRDALVTSANLTFYAMDRNMEMGVRSTGHPAADIAKHFELLIAEGVLEPYSEQRGLP